MAVASDEQSERGSEGVSDKPMVPQSGAALLKEPASAPGKASCWAPELVGATAPASVAMSEEALAEVMALRWVLESPWELRKVAPWASGLATVSVSCLD